MPWILHFKGACNSANEIWNKSVLSCSLNKSILDAVPIESGRLFNATGAATANARSRNFVEGLRLGWMSVIVDANPDHSVLRRSLVSSVIQRSERELGVIPFRALYTVRHNLNWIRSRHRSQRWRSRRSGVTCENRDAQKNQSSCTAQDGLNTIYLALVLSTAC